MLENRLERMHPAVLKQLPSFDGSKFEGFSLHLSMDDCLEFEKSNPKESIYSSVINVEDNISIIFVSEKVHSKLEKLQNNQVYGVRLYIDNVDEIESYPIFSPGT